MSSDDEFGMTAKGLLSPMKRLEEQTKQAEKLELEGAKTNRAIEVEDKRTDRAIKVAGVKATQDEVKALSKKAKEASRLARTNWETKNIPGSFMSTFTDSDNAKLMPISRERAEKYVIENGMEPAEAARKAGTDVGSAFAESKTKAVSLAKKLSAAGINPKDRESLKEALKAKNADAVALRDLMAEVRKDFDETIARHLFDELPAYDKKK